MEQKRLWDAQGSMGLPQERTVNNCPGRWAELDHTRGTTPVTRLARAADHARVGGGGGGRGRW